MKCIFLDLFNIMPLTNYDFNGVIARISVGSSCIWTFYTVYIYITFHLLCFNNPVTSNNYYMIQYCIICTRLPKTGNSGFKRLSFKRIGRSLTIYYYNNVQYICNILFLFHGMAVARPTVILEK